MPSGLLRTSLLRPDVSASHHTLLCLSTPRRPSQAFVKKFLRYVSKIRPRISEESSERISLLYMELRGSNDVASGALPITPRTLETIIRLSCAHAKLRLSALVELQDVEEAYAVMRFALLNETETESQRKALKARGPQGPNDSDDDGDEDDDNENDNDNHVPKPRGAQDRRDGDDEEEDEEEGGDDDEEEGENGRKRSGGKRARRREGGVEEEEKGPKRAKKGSKGPEAAGGKGKEVCVCACVLKPQTLTRVDRGKFGRARVSVCEMCGVRFGTC